MLLRQLLTHLVPWHTFSKTLDQDQAWNRNKHHIAKRAALTTVINKKQTWGKRLRFVTIASSKQCYKLLKLLFLVTVGGGKHLFIISCFSLKWHLFPLLLFRWWWSRRLRPRIRLRPQVWGGRKHRPDYHCGLPGLRDQDLLPHERLSHRPSSAVPPRLLHRLRHVT